MPAVRPIVSALLAAAAAVVCGAGPARAQGICGSRKAALAYLEARYHERPAALGLAADGRVLELLLSAGGSWTLLLTHPGGPTCVLATGEAWARLPEPPQEERGPRS